MVSYTTFVVKQKPMEVSKSKGYITVPPFLPSIGYDSGRLSLGRLINLFGNSCLFISGQENIFIIETLTGTTIFYIFLSKTVDF